MRNWRMANSFIVLKHALSELDGPPLFCAVRECNAVGDEPFAPCSHHHVTYAEAQDCRDFGRADLG